MESFVLLLVLSVMLEGGAASSPPLRRQKRHWLIPPTELTENVDYSRKGHVARIRSDSDTMKTLYYSLLGPGASEKPLNLFVVDELSGLVFVRGMLDREEREVYTLTGVARFVDGSEAEGLINITFVVKDENDNSPVFPPTLQVTVNESSPAGTLVGVITATDADKFNCSHSKIAYSIAKQEPFDGRNHFYIDRHTGSIYVSQNTLDRERQSSYILTIKGTDMDGAAEGNTGTGTVHVKILDINDNRPRLEKDEYTGSIMENTANREVMRFKVLDADEERTDNWQAVFNILTGNEDGIFSMKTDPKTNEGVLMLEKPVDFEESPDIKLGLSVSNVAPVVGDGGAGGAGGGGGGGGGGGASSWSTGASGSFRREMKRHGKLYPVNIAVLNEPEGVAFKPPVKPVSVSENPEKNPLQKVIAAFPATETDSGKLAENVRYAKGYDPDNWLSIDPLTAEIRLQKYPDRESPFLINGTYYAKILSMTHDVPVKIATGTIALQVGDVNDNCPSLINTVEYICSDTKVVNITALDEDAEPNSAPFSFSYVAKETQGEWSIQSLNDTSASLTALRPLWPGRYRVVLIIKDRQDLACPQPQYLDLYVCSCEGGETCVTAGLQSGRAFLKKSSSTFGGPGIGALILGLLSLLFVAFLLMTCSCGGVSGNFSELPFDTREHLIAYRTEGRGEDKDVPLLSAPVNMTPAVISAVQANTKANKPTLMTVDMGAARCRYPADERIQQSSFGQFWDGWMEGDSMNEELLRYDIYDMALSDVFLHQYYSQKASSAPEQAASDCLLEYDFEGWASSAGSVNCCSLLETDNDLQFLDDLGPKFKTLAEICSPPRPPEPLTCQSMVIQQVDKVDHVASSSLVAEPPRIHCKSPEYDHNASISHTSTAVMSSNQASSSSMHVHSSHSTSNMVESSHVNPASTAMLPSTGHVLLLQQQQPMYYTTTPVLQPMHYVVQPQLQSTVLLAEAPVPNLQGMVVLSGGSGYTEHTLQEGKSAGTLTLGREVGNRMVEVNQGVGTWLRSDGPGDLMSVRGSHQCIMSEGGGRMEHHNKAMATGGYISVEAAGSEQGPVVFTQRGNKTRSRSVASAQAHSEFIAAPEHTLQEGKSAATLTLGKEAGNRMVEVNQGVGTWLRSDGSGDLMSVRGSRRHILSEGGGRMEHHNKAMATGGYISVEAAGSEQGPVVFTQRGNKARRSTVSAQAHSEFIAAPDKTPSHMTTKILVG
uniref:desmoglein-3-like n=1 Tax=Scatophagus argus TaxID=75038 RepID=UPI001ED7F5C1|nr:desmoglein-3-like [Scatophagus argus]